MEKIAIWPRIEAFEHAFIHIVFKVPSFEWIVKVLDDLNGQVAPRTKCNINEFEKILVENHANIHQDEIVALWSRFLIYSQCVHEEKASSSAEITLSDLAVLLTLQLFHCHKSKSDIATYSDTFWPSPNQKDSRNSSARSNASHNRKSIAGLPKRRLDSRTVESFAVQYFEKLCPVLYKLKPNDWTAINLLFGASGCLSAAAFLSNLNTNNFTELQKGFKGVLSWHEDRHPQVEVSTGANHRIIRRSFAVKDHHQQVVPFLVENIHKQTDVRTEDLFATTPKSIPITIRDCELATVVVRSRARFVTISNCSRCEIFLPEIYGAVSIMNCSHVRVFAISASISLENVTDSFVSSLSSTRIIFLGGTNKMTLSPYCCVGNALPSRVHDMVIPRFALSSSVDDGLDSADTRAELNKVGRESAGTVTVYHQKLVSPLFSNWRNPLLCTLAHPDERGEERRGEDRRGERGEGLFSLITPCQFRPRILPTSQYWLQQNTEVDENLMAISSLYLEEDFANVLVATLKNMRSIHAELLTLSPADRQKITSEVFRRTIIQIKNSSSSLAYNF